MEHERSSQRADRAPTGIVGFDEIADGGLPRSGVTVVIGGPGAGKTIFALQTLAYGARHCAEPGILVAFEESAARLEANTASFAWGGEALRSSGVYVVDAQLSQSVEQGGEFDLVGLLAIVAAKAKQVGAKRVVFDGLDVLLGYLGSVTLVRREAFRLNEWVQNNGMSAIVTAKADNAPARAPADYDFLQFMADCVVTMNHRVLEGIALRFVRIAKYRGGSASTNEFPISIDSMGIEVAGNTKIELDYRVSSERISTGVDRLDSMLAGGYYRGTSVLITGAPGSAKTSLAAAFAASAARRGERTVYVSFDEAPDQIVRNVASIGLRLGPLVDAGTLHIHSFRARSESPAAHIARIRSLLRGGTTPTRNLIIDPLSALTQRGYEAEAESAALQVLDLAKAAGITVVSTSLLGGSAPLVEGSVLNVSTIADTWMHVSYVSQGGERNRALTVVKSRGSSHSNQVRELVLSERGVTLADVYRVGGEVLMGTLRWERENAERRTRTAARNDAQLRQQKAEVALADTKARMTTLAREQLIQETELAQLKRNSADESGRRTNEDDELLERRGADSIAAPAGIVDDAEQP